MLSTFSGIELGRQALNAFRLGMQTVGHNISNMSTEGYSRQRVNYATAIPMDLPGVGQVGQGMYANEILRIRDEFLDFQYRSNQANLGYWEKINDLYNSIQNYISEPNSNGIRSAMDTFFTNMQVLQQSPESVANRRSLVESAHTLGNMLSNLVNSFEVYNRSVNMEIQQSVDDANQMLYDIAALNKEIYHAEALDQNANDLRDQRDLIIDKLSKMMDISYNEPLETGGVTGEFFLSLNGRTLIQGDKVRELVAHSFLWDNQVFYDVQVSQNEFDIVDNVNVLDVLANGPEGSYQIMVDRIANGKEWTIGGGDAECLETRSVTTSRFSGGIMLSKNPEDNSTEVPRKISIRTLIGREDTDDEKAGIPVVLTVKIDWDSDSNSWVLRAEKDGEEIYRDDSFSDEDDDGNIVLTTENLISFMEDAIGSDDEGDLEASGLEIVAGDDEDPPSCIKFSSGSDRPLELIDYSGMLGSLTENKTQLGFGMRSRPRSVDEALNVSGTFRIQVGTQGTRVISNSFRMSAGSEYADGQILKAPGENDPKTHTFRVGVADGQVDFKATWNDSLNEWVLSSDLSVNADDTESVGSILTVNNITEYMTKIISKANSSSTAISNLVIGSGPANQATKTQFYIESKNNHLISISDVEGNLAERMGIVNKNPVISIEVTEDDTLTTIRNKINEKYQEELGLTQPEQWVHASLQQDEDESWYLTIASDVAGEAQRITLMGAEDGNMQVLRRLGLTKNEVIGTINDGEKDINIYRETSYIPFEGVAEDASFSLNGVRYLSSDNMFNQARKIPSTNRTDYSASTLTEVCEGMWFNLKEAGIASITVRHHVRDGSIKGLEDSRDRIIPGLKSQLDEMAYGLVKNLNAYQYSGYGIASDIDMTGVAFFDTLGMKSGAAKRLSVSDEIQNDNSLIGAAMGKKDANGIASSGVSGGSGDGTNASRMVGLTWAKVMGNGTMSVGEIYDAMLSQIGSEAGHAKLMYTTQATVSDQIDTQRQSISGVNLDEELMDIIVLNRAFGAMSRYITAMDEMLNSIINGFGLVGR